MDLLAINNPPDLIAAKTAAIHDVVLKESTCIQRPNIERIDVEDVALLFDFYDKRFFGGWLAQAVKDKTGMPLAFRLSPTMTRAGGKTILYRGRKSGNIHFEIAIASRMLLMTFRDVQREIIVCGLTCTDRLQALQRILEHEIIHLAEWLLWDESSCSGNWFKTLARRIFGHTDTKHALVTPREYAAVQHGVQVGSLVEFHVDGRRLVGKVNRISHRATVLVEDAVGRDYSDGKRYAKFYVPVEGLRPQVSV